ncbi:uncharacterized protein LOC131161606 [Malania oleifera]|uniref:uncharacterized protein LOC131161606 n=1 Tax=Malania oleifera TaxID=397392 RepID=UPI0025ADD187|nr:uncharacterized protein LOC131161606 [Malania oleifera]
MKKKGIKALCSNHASTSTLNQPNPPSLEDMILQLQLQEELARKVNNYNNIINADNDDSNYKLAYFFNDDQRRRSCVNNSDILRSAKNALNQYPRFSLDGKDAMYTSSFSRNVVLGAPAVGAGGRKPGNGFGAAEGLPRTVAGEAVVWCEPGVVAKLMGLEAVPVPVRGGRRRMMSSVIKRQNLRRRSVEVEGRELKEKRSGRRRSCPKKTDYCVLKPTVNGAAASPTGPQFL